MTELGVPSTCRRHGKGPQDGIIRKAGSAIYSGEPPRPLDWLVTVRYACGDRACDATERILAPEDGRVSVGGREIPVTVES